MSNGGRGIKTSPAGQSLQRSREARLNRILLIGGGGLAVGAVLLALAVHPFNFVMLLVNLGAIGLGLVMGKGIGMFMFRRVLPTTK
jgi:hypothetical protein